MPKTVRRFYEELKPSHYELTLAPDAVRFTFEGNVTVRLTKTARPSKRLTFHQKGLRITAATITKVDKKGDHDIEVVRINNQDTLNEVRLHTKELLYSGNYRVTMNFQGPITKGMTGLYPCFFTHHGKEHVLLATQFESHHAREVFPCIDEPEAKATFQLSLLVPEKQIAISNTPVLEQRKVENGLSHVTFAPTPRMSTYLLAFVIGELRSKSAKTKNGTEVSLWATIAQPVRAFNFGLGVAVKSVEFFEDYFWVHYPLAKIDHVALPDFSSGAMENWGLITYRERYLLAYPKMTSQSIKETIATVVAHETAHQWFGNLVTMRWWDDLWLNESFANLMEYQAVNSMFPEWQIWETFIMNEGLAALRRDATPGVQAIKTSVRHPDEISTLFDPSIVYAKGGRLLYMLKTYIGEAAFRKGLTAYFTKHAYGNTTGDDLWQALKLSSGIDVASFMNPWLEQSGFPMIRVDQQKDRVVLHQSHFLESGEASDERLWPVPLFTSVEGLPSSLNTSEGRYSLKNSEPLYINQGSAGHYIVDYVRPAHQKRIVQLVEHQAVPPVDRLMLLNGASMLSKAAQQPFGDVLRLLKAYDNETSEPVWNMMALIVSEARRFIDLDGNLEKPLKAFLRTLIRREYSQLGWNETAKELTADRKLRATILSLGAYADDPTIVQESLKRFAAYKRDPEAMAAELRAIVFGVAVKHDKEDAFDFLLSLHNQTANSDLREDITSALTLTKETAKAALLLERLKDPKLVKPQDAETWLFYLMRNRFVREISWQWMVDNWQWVKQTYAQDKSYDNFPRYAASICNTKVWAKKYHLFFAPMQDDISLKRNIAIGLSEIDTRVKWLERDLDSVKDFLAHSA